MEDPVLTVERLLRLAASHSEGESVAAACAAVKLINKHGLVVIRGTSGGNVTFPEPSPEVRVQTAEAPDDEAPQKMRAKYDGYCRSCLKFIARNESILWRRSEGAYHPRCYANRPHSP